jgi:two-component system, sensor histidine kinase
MRKLGFLPPQVMLDALRAQGDDALHRDRLIHDLDVNMDALRALFDQVLEVTRLEAGTVLLQPRAVRLQELFARLQARFALQALNEGVRLEFSITQAIVMADPLALERMVANLLGNALKHTPEGGTVWVGWRAQRNTLEVRDSGAGIAPDQQQRIFDEFYQIHQSGDHTQGLGLGLAIVKRLAALGGQTVGVRSALGLGSTFWLKLEAAQESSHPAIAKTEYVVAAISMPLEKVKQRQLLFVENDATLLRLTSSLLRMNDWQVHAFVDADEAMDWLRTGVSCDLLLTDFRMGTRWDGAQLIEAARALPERSHLPAIVMTGDGAVAELASMTRLQAGGVQSATTRLLHKPVKTAQLLQVMSESVNGAVPSKDLVIPA